MSRLDVTINLLAADDITGITALQEQNQLDRGGMLSARFSAEWFERAAREMPIIVAREGDAVVGYLVSATVAAQSHLPIIQAMLRAYHASGDAYIYGPVCVAQSHRRTGLARVMFYEMLGRLPGREAICFIRADNAASRAAHERMGMRETARFVLGETTYVVLAYRGGAARRDSGP